MREIDPGQKLSYQGIVHVVKPIENLKEKEFKLGFVFIKKNEVVQSKDFYKVLIMKIKEQKDIIWGKPFKIDK